MSCNKPRNSLMQKIINTDPIVFCCPEEYFFVLGQLITYIFEMLGGVNSYKTELNYLTNPYLPKSIYQLGQRNLRFLKHLPQLLVTPPTSITRIYQALLNNQTVCMYPTIQEDPCSDAFYHGLYTDNYLVKHFGSYIN